MSSLTYPHFSFATHTMNNGTMLEAMNILLYDDSLQAETLGDARLIAVLASITRLLHLVDMFIQKNCLLPHQVKKKNNSIALQRIWKSLFKHIRWIMTLSWISMNSSSQESMNILGATTTKSIIEQ